MWWIGCVRWEKFRRDFVARTFALIATVHPVLHRVWCSYETIPNAPKHYATHQNMSLESNGVDWVRLMWKIATRIRGTNCCINCISSAHLHRVPCSYEMIPNAPKHYETNQMVWIGCVRCEKFRCDFVARASALTALVHLILYRV